MISWDPLNLAMFVVVLGNVALGLVIGYQAYRGFRRHESGPMRYLSIGLILLTAVAYTLAFVSFWLVYFGYIPSDFGRPLALLYRLVQFAGLSFITYSLYRRS